PFCKRKYIKIIYNGVGDEFFPLEKGSKNDHNLPSSKYVLFVGTRFPYKNFDLVVNILEVMPDINLVLVGGGKLKAHEHKKMVSKIRNRFMHYESISAIKLNELYNRAHCLLYPSKY
ncbi:glycosyltransferase, partial [Providencia stuartii]|uniref:glycosyltransferase n=1 Tax=Providencia stuartii TaxID=588 RepID=UPI002989E5BB